MISLHPGSSREFYKSEGIWGQRFQGRFLGALTYQRFSPVTRQVDREAKSGDESPHNRITRQGEKPVWNLPLVVV